MKNKLALTVIASIAVISSACAVDLSWLDEYASLSEATLEPAKTAVKKKKKKSSRYGVEKKRYE